MKITNSQYAKVLFEMTDGKSEQDVLKVILDFSLKLRKDGQVKNIERIIEKFSEIFNKENGIVEAEVVTRHKIENAESVKIEDFIKEKYKANKVILKNIVDEKNRGGIVIRVGDEVMDASVENKLKKLKNILSK